MPKLSLLALSLGLGLLHHTQTFANADYLLAQNVQQLDLQTQQSSNQILVVYQQGAPSVFRTPRSTVSTYASSFKLVESFNPNPQGNQRRFEVWQTLDGKTINSLSKRALLHELRSVFKGIADASVNIAFKPSAVDINPNSSQRYQPMNNPNNGQVKPQAFDFTGTDPLVAMQWHLHNTDMVPGGANFLSAWPKSKGANTLVAIIDDGYVPHPEINTKSLAGKGFVKGDQSPDNERIPCPTGPTGAPISYHGAMMSMITGAFGNNGISGSGAAPDTNLIPIKVLNQCGGTLADVARGILWSAGASIEGYAVNTNIPKVLNLSLSGFSICDESLQSAVDFARQKNIVLVAAAGNTAFPTLNSPANCKGVVSVQAHSLEGDLTNYSNYSGSASISAPGGGSSRSNTSVIREPIYTGGFSEGGAPINQGTVIGTSPAAAIVSGAVAMSKTIRTDLVNEQIIEALGKSATAWPSQTFCASQREKCAPGLLNASAFLDTIQTMTPAKVLTGPELFITEGGAPITISVENLGPGFTYQWPEPLAFLFYYNSVEDASKGQNRIAPPNSSTIITQAPFKAGSYTLYLNVLNAQKQVVGVKYIEIKVPQAARPKAYDQRFTISNKEDTNVKLQYQTQDRAVDLRFTDVPFDTFAKYEPGTMQFIIPKGLPNTYYRFTYTVIDAQGLVSEPAVIELIIPDAPNPTPISQNPPPDMTTTPPNTTPDPVPNPPSTETTVPSQPAGKLPPITNPKGVGGGGSMNLYGLAALLALFVFKRRGSR